VQVPYTGKFSGPWSFNSAGPFGKRVQRGIMTTRTRPGAPDTASPTASERARVSTLPFDHKKKTNAPSWKECRGAAERRGTGTTWEKPGMSRSARASGIGNDTHLPVRAETEDAVGNDKRAGHRNGRVRAPVRRLHPPAACAGCRRSAQAGYRAHVEGVPAGDQTCLG
jgi:hypothetical protein